MSISSVSGTSSWQYPPPPPTGSSDGQKSFLDTAAKALGMSTEDVTSALEDGSSLADLAKNAGVSEDDLISALEANAPDDLKASDKLDEITKKMVESPGLQGPPPGGPQGGPTGLMNGDMTDAQSRTLDQLSSLLDTDAGSLTSALQSGTSLADLAQQQGVSYDQLASVLQSELQSGYLIDTSL